MAGEEGFAREEREQPVLRQQERQEQQADEHLQRQTGPDRYMHGQLPDQAALSAHQAATHMTGVYDAVSSFMPEAYDPIRRLHAVPNEARPAPLHHARGHRLAMQDDVASVLEFDMAGSGFQQFRREHKGFKGKGKFKPSRDEAEIGVNEKDEKHKTVRFFNRWRFLNWIPGIKTAAKIEEHNLGVDKRNARRRAARQALAEQYGATQTVGGQERQHVRRKDSSDEGKTRTRISMAGPLALGGLLNRGDYSIENLRKYMREMAANYIAPIVQRWRDGGDETSTLPIIIKGHSRGAVAAAEGAMMIRQWLLDNYSEYADRIKFELIQYDPVPGAGSASGVNEKVDLNNGEGYTDEGDKMAALGASANTTVVYSLHTDHKFFFTPQMVKGAKRIVLTPFKHSVGLDKVDNTEIRQGNERVAGNHAHSASYADAQSGDVYRGSGLSDLAEGVFIVDENDTLVRFTDYAQAKSVIDRVLAETSGQEDRHALILEVVRTWFEDAAARSSPQA